MKILPLCITIGIFILFVNQFKYDKCSRRMLIVYLAYWFIAMILSSLQVADLNPVNPDTHYLLIGHLLSFILGYSAVKISPNTYYGFSRVKIGEQIKKLTSNRIFRTVVIISTLYSITLLIVFFQRVMFYDTMTEARGDYFSGDLYGPAFSFVNQLVLAPLTVIVLPLFAYKIYYSRDWFTYLMLIFLFTVSGLSGGRNAYVRIVVVLAFVLFFLFDSIKSKKKLLLYSILTAFILFSVLSFISAARSGMIGFDSDSLETGKDVALEQLVTYSSGPIAAFDYSIANNYVEMVGGYKHGRLTLTSLDRTMCFFLRKLGFHAEEAMNSVGELKQNYWIQLGGVRFNALYTSCFIYYLDFGVWGVLILPFILGYIFRKTLLNLYRHNTLSLLILMSWFFWVFFRSVQDFGFYSPFDCVLIFFLYVLGKKRSY